MLLDTWKRSVFKSSQPRGGDFWSDLFQGGGEYHSHPESNKLPQLLHQITSPLESLTRQLILGHPLVSRTQRRLLRWLQKRHAVLNLGPLTIVTGYAAAKAVLGDDAHFSVEKVYAERTNRDNGPFVLSMDPDELQAREKALLNQVMPAEDLQRINLMLDQWIEQALAIYRPKGRLDLVQNFTRQIPYLFIKEYLGVPGPDDRLLKLWLSDIFADVFTNIFNRREVAERGEQAGQALANYLVELISETQQQLISGQSLPDTVLTRMVRCKSSYEWLNDDTIRRNISGLMVGALETLNKATVKVVEALWQRPELYADILPLAKGCAADKRVDTKAFKSLTGYVQELLRFHPHNPFVLRYCQQNYTFNASSEMVQAQSGTPNRSKRGQPTYQIRANRWVIVSTYAAQHDPDYFDSPETIDPLRQQSYLHYGSGLHTCQGAMLNHLLLPKMVSAIATLPKLRPLHGLAGMLHYKGTFPTRWYCQFEIESTDA